MINFKRCFRDRGTNIAMRANKSNSNSESNMWLQFEVWLLPTDWCAYQVKLNKSFDIQCYVPKCTCLISIHLKRYFITGNGSLYFICDKFVKWHLVSSGPSMKVYVVELIDALKAQFAGNPSLPPRLRNKICQSLLINIKGPIWNI